MFKAEMRILSSMILLFGIASCAPRPDAQSLLVKHLVRVFMCYDGNADGHCRSSMDIPLGVEATLQGISGNIFASTATNKSDGQGSLEADLPSGTLILFGYEKVVPYNGVYLCSPETLKPVSTTIEQNSGEVDQNIEVPFRRCDGRDNTNFQNSSVINKD